MDAFPQVRSDANKTPWGESKYDAIQQGLVDIVKETRAKIGDDKLIFYNGIRTTATIQIGNDFMVHSSPLAFALAEDVHESRIEEAPFPSLQPPFFL